MSSEFLQLVDKLAEMARARVDEEEARIDAILAARKAAEATQQQHPQTSH